MMRYITIRADARYSEIHTSAPLISFLDHLQRDPKSSNRNWRDVVVLAMASAQGNYSTNGECPKNFNVVELLCYPSEAFQFYETLACEIAQFLGWQAHDDNEGQQLWPKS